MDRDVAKPARAQFQHRFKKIPRFKKIHPEESRSKFEFWFLHFGLVTWNTSWITLFGLHILDYTLLDLLSGIISRFEIGSFTKWK